jgi:hypothetical protein
MKKKPSAKKSSLPGYPPYPPEEDMMSGKGDERMDVNVEDLAKNTPGAKLKKNKPVKKSTDSSPEIIPGTEADLTPEDMDVLGSAERSNDGGDDELLDDLQLGPDFSGDDLDVPGSEADDDMEDIGSEDEENNYYSRGQE